MSGAQFWRIAAPRGNLALRRWPTEYPPPNALRFIHDVLVHAARRGITILPVPITTHDGQSFVRHAGYLWELAPWMSGTPDYARAPSVEKLRAMMKTLAQFHLAVSDFGGGSVHRSAGESSAVKSRLTRLGELSHGGQRQLAQAVTDRIWPDIAPLARQFLAALPHAVPRSIALHELIVNEPFSIQPCIRDIWHENVLFTGDKVTGIVDFGAMDFDTPACDVARLLGSLGTVPFSPGPVLCSKFDATAHRESAAKRGLSPLAASLATDTAQVWRDGLAAYASVRQLSANELRAVAAFDTSIVLLAGCNWIRWIYIEGRQFENPEQVLRHFRRIVEQTQAMQSANAAATLPRSSPA
jgi:homoserine kinase type II